MVVLLLKMLNSLQHAIHTRSKLLFVLYVYGMIYILVYVHYRHTEEMIEKLESAGLGFYVKATETQQKLGSFQIRMYSVLTMIILLHS